MEDSNIDVIRQKQRWVIMDPTCVPAVQETLRLFLTTNTEVWVFPFFFSAVTHGKAPISSQETQSGKQRDN